MGSAATAAERLHGAVGLDRAVRAALSAQIPAPAANASEIQDTRWRAASRVLRSMQSWRAPVGSGTSDLQRNELTTMRACSRDAPIARSALVRSRTSIVGTGLVCRPAVDHKILGITPEQAEAYNTQLRSS